MSELPNGPADIAAGITQALADIRRHWKGTENPPRRSLAGARVKHSSCARGVVTRLIDPGSL